MEQGAGHRSSRPERMRRAVAGRRRSLTQADAVERVRQLMRTRRAAKFSG